MLPILLIFSVLQTLLNVLATALASLVYLQARRLSAERNLLAAALAQAPDFTYIKDNQSRFAAVNNTMAQYNGFCRPEEVVGKTDFDLTTPDHAQALFEREQEILAGGTPLLGVDEHDVDKFGREIWFSASKVPLRDAEGSTIGLAGVTRDITADKRLRQELVESRDTPATAARNLPPYCPIPMRTARLFGCRELPSLVSRGPAAA
jgi:PAS domain S-box-containing protein